MMNASDIVNSLLGAAGLFKDSPESLVMNAYLTVEFSNCSRELLQECINHIKTDIGPELYFAEIDGNMVFPSFNKYVVYIRRRNNV